MVSRDVGRTVRRLFNVHDGRVSHHELRHRIIMGAAVDGIHMCQLIAAMTIASIGLNVDSTEAVIGAMLICPLMGSVLAIAYSIATLDRQLLKESIAGIAVQFAVCLATSTLYFAISPLSGQTNELLTNSTATIWDVIIALVGGLAGALGTSRRQEPATLIAGVAVATALMPPLCAVGFGLAGRDLAFAAAALYEFLVNVVFIAFGSEIVFVWLRVPLQSDLDGDGTVTEEEKNTAEQRSRILRRRLVFGLVIFAVPCFFFSARVVQLQMAQNGTLLEIVDSYDTEMVTRELAVLAPEITGYRIGNEDSYDLASNSLNRNIVATIELTTELSDEQRKLVEDIVRLHVHELARVAYELTS